MYCDRCYLWQCLRRFWNVTYHYRRNRLKFITSWWKKYGWIVTIRSKCQFNLGTSFIKKIKIFIFIVTEEAEKRTFFARKGTSTWCHCWCPTRWKQLALVSALAIYRMFCLGFIIGFIYRWIIHMEGASGTIYEGESFQLQFKFSNKYPFDSPEVNVNSDS